MTVLGILQGVNCNRGALYLNISLRSHPVLHILAWNLPGVILRALRDLDLVLDVAGLVDHHRHGGPGGRSLKL